MVDEERKRLVDNSYVDRDPRYYATQGDHKNYGNGDLNCSSSEAVITIPRSSSTRFSFRKLWAFTGPGFLMSIAYLDPGNIDSDLQAGAIAGFKLLWVLWWSTVMGLLLQISASKLGTVTGRHLAEHCRCIYPLFPRIVIWLMMEIAIIGTDIQEVIGSAIAINLLSSGKIPIYAGVIITAVDTFIFLLLQNYDLRKLEAFFGLLISIMAGTFLYMYIVAAPDQNQVVLGVVVPSCPNCSAAEVEQAVGIVGSVVMPHNLYLHSALVLSRTIDRESPGAIKEANMYYLTESSVALFISFLINLFVTSVFAQSFRHGNCPKAQLRTAGDCIHRKFGDAAKIIWGIGLLAAGQSATMTGTYAGQFIMEGFTGINWPKWKRMFITRSIAIFPSMIVAILAKDDLDTLNNLVNVSQSILLPFAVFPLMYCISNQQIMGQFRIGMKYKTFLWLVSVLVLGFNFYSVFDLLISSHVASALLIIIIIFSVFYVLFILYLLIGPKAFDQVRSRFCHL